MPGKIVKTCSSPHEEEITGIVYCPKTDLLYTSGGDLKVKVSWIDFWCKHYNNCLIKVKASPPALYNSICLQVWDKDLNLKNEVLAGESWLYAIAVTESGKVYVGSNDGTLRVVADPLNDKGSTKVLECKEEIFSVYCDKEKAYCGDDKGVVSVFEDGKFISRVETSESCMGLKVEDNFIYTIRDRDLSINNLNTTKMLATLTSRAVIPGRIPIDLFGPVVNGHRALIILPFRSGKGFAIIYNDPAKKFGVCAQTEEDAHEMIIYGVAGLDNIIYSGDFSGKLKKWILDVEGKKLTLDMEFDVCPGACINGLAAIEKDIVYVASSDGILRKVHTA